MAISRYIKTPPVGDYKIWFERELEAVERSIASLSEATSSAASLDSACVAAFAEVISGADDTVSFDEEKWDTASFWAAGSPTVFTVPATGTYHLTLSYNGGPSNTTTTNFTMAIIYDGVGYNPISCSDVFWTTSTVTNWAGVVSGLFKADSGDTFHVRGDSSTATNFTADFYFQIMRIS